MCGICGVLNKTGRRVEQKAVSKMCKVLYHRGPDDDGFYFNGCVGLGMRRLSIIDLDTGKQPIHNEDKSIWVVLNGEIYNYQELAQKLSKRGHIFYTKSDTETIVHLYEDYGEECVQYLRGMFAFAIWDNNKKKLILARDRVGIKPLFYYEDFEHLIFGSEIKSILQYPKNFKEIDYVALDQFLTILYVPTPRTIYKTIKKLPPGHILVASDKEIKIEKYWELQYQIDDRRSLEETVEIFNSKFEEAVKIRMISDVPLGALLSGGIDSSAVVAAMCKQSNEIVDTFTIGYQKTAAFFDETEYAQQISSLFGTRHHQKIVEPKVKEILVDVIGNFDEPFADGSEIPNYYISQFAREHVTVMLSGLGGDEIAAGYNRYLALLLSKYYDKVPKIIREKLVVNLVNSLPDSQKGYRFADQLKRFVNSGSLPTYAQYASYITFLPESEKNDLYSPPFSTYITGELEGLIQSYFNQHSNLDLLSRALFTDLKMYLPDDLLTLTDRMSMAHSLEVRVPYLDHELLEFMATIPPQFKLRHFTKKYFLKKAFENTLPREILHRGKKGFSLPLSIWFRSELKEFVSQTLSKRNINSIGLFNFKKILETLELHFRGKENHNRRIWALIVFTNWYKHHFENST